MFAKKPGLSCKTDRALDKRRSLREKQAQKNRSGNSAAVFLSYSKLLLGLGLDLAKRVTVVGQAIFAHPVRQPVSPALGTSHDTGSLQLPNGAAPLIAPGLGHFSLRNRHG